MWTLQQLRIVRAIRDHGSLTQTAAALGYGTPTVTHHLGLLERHLGAPLVVRSRRGVELTPLGELVADEASVLLERLDRLEQAVHDASSAGVTVLRVGTFASIGSKLLPRAIRALQERANVRVEVVEAEPHECAELLARGEIHAGLIYDYSEDPAFTSSSLSLQPLLREPYLVCVSATGPWASAAEIDFAELGDVQWVCARHEDASPGRALQRACRMVGQQPVELIRTDDLIMIHALVAEGLGMSVQTASATLPQLGVRLVPAVQPLGFRQVHFALPREGSVPAAALLGSLLTDVAAGYEASAA